MKLAAWLGVWLALMLGSTLLHRTVWLAPADDPPSMIVHAANNISHMLTLPGWVGAKVLTGGWRTVGWAYPMLASGSAWAGWLVGLAILLRMRRGAVMWRAGPPRMPVLRSLFVLPEAPAALGRPESSRRRFLVDAPVALAGLTATGSLVRATIVEPWDLRIVRYRVPIADLPAGLEGLRIVQLSDTHLGPRIAPSYIEKVVGEALALKPDLFLLTGDYITAGQVHIDPAARLFRPLVVSGVPVVGVLGNHDWYGNGPRMSAALRAAGVRMVDNAHVYLSSRDRRLMEWAPEEGLCLAGLGDLHEDVVDVRRAFEHVPEAMPRLLLSHNPDAAELGAFSQGPGVSPRVDLMISGHTHGGQVHIPFLGTPGIPSAFGQKYAGGLIEGPAFRVLVSRGVGMSLLPIRFGVPPEISEITLVRA